MECLHFNVDVKVCELCAPQAVVAVVLQGLEAGPGPHVPGEQGLVRPVLRSDDEREVGLQGSGEMGASPLGEG